MIIIGIAIIIVIIVGGGERNIVVHRSHTHSAAHRP